MKNKITPLIIITLFVIVNVTFGQNMVGEQKWDLLSPTPQANYLHGVYMTDENSAIAVGELSTIIRTVDAGVSWDIKHFTTEKAVRLNDIVFVNDDTGWIVGDEGVIMHSVDGGITWNENESGTEFELHSVHFTDSDNGWISGAGGTLLRTIDGGTSWTSVEVPTTHFIYDVFFISEETGWITGELNEILKTSDGGATWSVQAFPENNRAESIFFIDELIGWAGGRAANVNFQGQIFYTDDGGDTWIKQNNSLLYGFSLTSLQFLDESNGWASVTATPGAHFAVELLRTTNGGENWIGVDIGSGISAVHFTDSGNGMAVGYNGNIFSSGNAGEEWHELTQSLTNENLSDIFMVNNSSGWAVGNSRNLFYTTDGGNTWEKQNGDFSGGPGTVDIYAVHFTDEQTGWIVANGGLVNRTYDAGQTWEKVDVGAGSSNNTLRAVYFFDDETGWIGGGEFQNVILRKTTDGGTTWEDASNGALDVVNEIFFTDENTGWYAFNNGIYKTEDGGDTWNLNIGGIGVRGIHFFDDQRGFITGTGSLLKYTDDGGITWEDVNEDISGSFSDIAFTDEFHGWIVGNEIYHTSDGGSTWTHEIKPSVHMLQAVSVVDKQSAWIAGDSGILMRSSDAVLVSTERDHFSDIPGQITLAQNYPNPFNPVTVIGYELPVSSEVRLEIIDLLGRRVAVLVNGRKEAGVHEVTFDASHLSSGVYLYRLQAGSVVFTKKLTLIK